MMIQWDKVTAEDRAKVRSIIRRAIEQGIPPAMAIDCEMSIIAAHIFQPLDLDRLYVAPDFDFVHDLTGINKHVNHDTGCLENAFMPRCGFRKEKEATN